MKVKFQSFSSGSCGNCYLLGIFSDDGKREAAILIDAGVSPRRLKKELPASGLSLDDIDAMLVTHDHLDHIRSLGSYCKYLRIPVWSTQTLLRALSRHTMTGTWLGDVRRPLSDGWNEIVPGRISARCFEVPHDATQTVGYAIMLDGYKFVIMTDVGAVPKEALDFASQADTVVIEANYDLQMLRNGPYPKDLQDRICQGHGHLSNRECAEAVERFSHDGLRNIFLCHLSEHNNEPELALDTVRPAVREGVRLEALPRQTPSQLFEL